MKILSADTVVTCFDLLNLFVLPYQPIILPDEDTCFLDMDIFNEHLVLFLNKEGSLSMCSIKMPIMSDCKVESLPYFLCL